jgi:hypothetical protein
MSVSRRRSSLRCALRDEILGQDAGIEQLLDAPDVRVPSSSLSNVNESGFGRMFFRRTV